MKRMIPVIFILAAVLPAALAETQTLDKNKFVAPGSAASGLKAPASSLDEKMPGPGNPASGPTVTGEKRPIAPVNGVCPDTYHCRSMNNGASFLCMPNNRGLSLSGPHSCSNVVRWCKAYEDTKARGGVLDEADHEKYAYYCI